MTRDSLLTGVHHSLRTAELRLAEAHHLYESGFFSGATILALFGQEELGRAVALHKLYVDTPVGTEIAIETITSLRDHEDRLALGRLGNFLRAPASINREIQKVVASGSPENLVAARSQLDKLHWIKARRHPKDLQTHRERAQYVDPISNEAWNRPWAISQVTAYEVLSEALAHLFNHCSRLVANAPLMAVWQTLPESDRPSFPPRIHFSTTPAAANRDA